jgi:putative adenylate-forming enzyme
MTVSPLTLSAFARARFGLRFRDRAALLDWQARQVAAFLRCHLPQAPFYRRFTGQPLAALPLMDKATVLANFTGCNTRGVTLERALAVALEAEQGRDFRPVVDGLTVGLSSGTSGARGVFLVSDAERARWAGLLLARLLTPASLAQLASPWRPPLRVAFFLRASSNLYTTLSSRRLAFRWHDLLAPLDHHLAALEATPPDVLAAPPTVLRRLAEARAAGALRVAPRQVISVAEVLDPADESVIAAAFGVTVQQVYQATEGFLGATCPAGRIHLNEEHVCVEPEWLDAARTRFHPVVTDFSRTTQLIIRYRLDDVLRVSEDPCPCGRAARVVAAVEGRADEVLWRPSRAGGPVVALFPDVLRRAVAVAGAGVQDWRIEQEGDRWRLALDSPDASGASRAIVGELERLWASTGAAPAVVALAPWTPQPIHQKRRRIRCLSQ